MRIRRALTCTMFLAVVASALSAQVWKKKDYHEWSLEDCARVLKDSPWAKSRAMGTSALQQTEAAVPGRDQEPQITYAVQFLSALPVRQALARQRQLDPAFQKLSAEEKQASQERFAKLIANPYTDQVVVRLYYGTTVDAYRVELIRAYGTMILGEWQRSSYLNTPSARLSPVHVDASEHGVVILVFQRLKDGKPVVQETDKEISFEFMSKPIGVFSSERIILFFKVKDMLVNEKISY
jgi:hypothetical protein